MTRPVTGDAIRRTMVVAAGIDKAFEVFTSGLASWWPPEYTWSGDALDTIGIEPRRDGPCYEIGPHGFRVDWGRVLDWEPPRWLVLAWQISPRRQPVPDPAGASEIELRFVEEGPASTRVEFEHRAFDRHGDESGDYRAALESPGGWPYILDRYAAAVG